MLLFVVVTFLSYGVTAVRFPVGLSYSEGVVWQQLLRIPSSNMYGGIAEYPFTVFEYPPVYYLAVKGMMAFSIPALVAGRIVSLTSTLISCALLSSLIYRSGERGSRTLVGGILGGLLPLSLMPVIAWVPTMRVDMLGLALTLTGLWLATVTPLRRVHLYLAAITFVAAIFTKQTFIAAPFAVAFVGLRFSPRRMLETIVFGGLVAIVATALRTPFKTVCTKL